MRVFLQCMCRAHVLCMISFDRTSAPFEFIKIGSANAVTVFTATSQVHRWEFFLLNPLIYALFVNCRQTVYNLIYHEGLPTIQMGKLRRIDPESLHAWLKESEQRIA